MNLTFGFILFFISIVIPGFIFRRIYFFGEFSKEYNTKDPVLHSIFFSVIPGITVHLIAFVVYDYFFEVTHDFDKFIIFYKDITSGSPNITEETKFFLKEGIVPFIKYSFFIFFIALVLGFLSSRLIRTFKLDRKYKTFRYKNQWYYIFSGEILNMKKFEMARHINFNKSDHFHNDVSVTYADILVKSENSENALYTGFVVDYDLKSDDVTQLDKIYLLDTNRYKKFNNEIKFLIKNIIVVNNIPKSSRERVKIPGDVFILNAEDIININLTFVPSPEKIQHKKIKKETLRQRIYSILSFFNSIFIISIIFIQLFNKLFNLENTFLGTYIHSVNIFGKFLTTIFLITSVSILFPKVNKEKRYYHFTWKNFIIWLVFNVILGLIIYFFFLKNIYNYLAT